MSSNSLSGLRVLEVEDETLVALLFEDALDEIGCEVVGRARSPAEALAAIEADAVDVVILDVNLGGEESYEVADALAARDVPFLLTSAYGRETLRDGYRDQPLIQKPFTQADLAHALARALKA